MVWIFNPLIINTQMKAVWDTLKLEAQSVLEREPVLSSLLEDVVLSRQSLGEALAYRLTRKLDYNNNPKRFLMDLFFEAFQSDPVILNRVALDIIAVKERDPACEDYITPFLYYKGFQAITCYRVAHWLWTNNRKDLAYYMESMISEVFSVDIHPAARIGGGLLLDHATGFVAGETALIEDNVSILHEVTLGGTGKVSGDRHPKVRSGVLIGAGAKILGNVEIGVGAKIGASSVVLDDIPSGCTAAGVPAKILSENNNNIPASLMDHRLGKKV